MDLIRSGLNIRKLLELLRPKTKNKPRPKRKPKLPKFRRKKENKKVETPSKIKTLRANVSNQSE
jgi:hypothetical protein